MLCILENRYLADIAHSVCLENVRSQILKLARYEEVNKIMFEHHLYV